MCGNFITALDTTYSFNECKNIYTLSMSMCDKDNTFLRSNPYTNLNCIKKYVQILLLKNVHDYIPKPFIHMSPVNHRATKTKEANNYEHHHLFFSFGLRKDTRKPTLTWGEHTNHTEMIHLGFQPGTFLL